MSGERERIVVTARVQRHGHEARVVSAEVTSGPPHVRRFHEGSLAEVTDSLSADGYRYSVRTVFEDVSLLDWLGASP